MSLTMYKIAVLGDRDSVYGIAALGLHVYPVDTPEQGARTLKALAAQEYAVIYVTEALASAIAAEIDLYREQRLPAIILIPGVSGNTGEGIRSVHKSVEQAVGSDILFGGK